jgi:hypothetical protein
VLLADDVLASIRADRAGASDLLTDWTASWSIVVQSVNKPSGGFRTRTQTERNKAVILEILTTGFSSKDFTALDRYLHPDYVQHNAFIPPAKAGLSRSGPDDWRALGRPEYLRRQTGLSLRPLSVEHRPLPAAPDRPQGPAGRPGR